MRFESILAAALPALVLAAPTPQDPDFTWDDQTPEESIVGGTAAAAGEFPFIASLQLNGRHLCGGTLINGNTIVTAAHCSERSLIGGPANVRVRLGSLNNASGGTLVSVSQVISHPNYREDGEDYDIAIWKLSSSVPAGGNIAYARIAAANSDPAGGATTTVAGWGALREGGSASATLQKVSVPVVARTTCNSQYGGAITARMFCAGYTSGGRDSCQGDSGGPIVDSSKTLVGVVSWGNGCARPNFPGVYARVGALTSFIQQYS